MVQINPDKARFISLYPIDKIIDDYTVITVEIGAASFVDSPVTNAGSVTYDVGENVVASGIFSVDGSNWYPLGTSALGEPSGGNIETLTAEVACDATSIFARVTNGFLSAKTFQIVVYLESVT